MITKDNEPDVSKIIVDCIFKVHKALGPGLLENAYEACLEHEIRKRNLGVERQKTLPVSYDGVKVEAGYKLDLLIEESFIVELKAVEKMNSLYQAQLITYLKLSNIKTGLLVNFNRPLIKDGIKRISV
ncbi:MAG: GxxExxY protein [Alphaproteobacteria bacterium]